MTDRRTGPLDSLRPIGATFERVTGGYKSTYEVVGHVRVSEGVFREDVRRIKFEKLKT